MPRHPNTARRTQPPAPLAVPRQGDQLSRDSRWSPILSLLRRAHTKFGTRSLLAEVAMIPIATIAFVAVLGGLSLVIGD